MANFALAWKAFWLLLKDGPTAEKWTQLISGEYELKKPEEKKSEPPKPKEKINDAFPADAVYTLTLLQRSGRLIDFLKEDISSYDDAQIGAAVREIHAGCGKVLDEVFAVQTVKTAQEGETVEVEEHFDPSAIRLSGTIGNGGPCKGTLRHKGWRATKCQLPERSAKIDPKIIQPAEVEL